MLAIRGLSFFFQQVELHHKFLLLSQGSTWEHLLSTLEPFCQMGLRCQHHSWHRLDHGHHGQGGHPCSPAPAASIRANPPTFRYTDVWTSQESQHAMQRILCRTMDVLQCNLQGTKEYFTPPPAHADVTPLMPHT